MQLSFLSHRSFKNMTDQVAPMYLPNLNGILFESSEARGTDGIYIILDMQEVVSGLLYLDIDLPEETEILIGWGEHLTDLRV